MPSPTTITLSRWRMKLHFFLYRIQPVEDVLRGDGDVAFVLAGDAGGYGAQYGRDDRRLRRDTRQRRVGQERVSRTHRVDHLFGKTVNGEERPDVEAGPQIRDDASAPKLQNHRFTLGFFVKLERQGPHDGILIAQGKTRFPFVGRDEVEALKFENISPAAGDLAVRDFDRPLRQGR